MFESSEYNPMLFTPIEIWVKILGFLLDDPVIFSPNPFYLGCNVHTALRQWHDQPLLDMVGRQRGTLRLVCRAWRDLADAHLNRYYRIPRDSSFIDVSQMRSASRLNISGARIGCSCVGQCTCSDTYFLASPEADSLLPTDLIRAFLSDKKLRVSILTIVSREWSRMTEIISRTSNIRALSYVKALEIYGTLALAGGIPIVCPNLTFLSIQLSTTRYAPPSTVTRDLLFPNLTTLILSLIDLYAYHIVEPWKLPLLRHMEITEIDDWGRGDGILTRFVAKDWPNLVSLKVVSKFDFISLPPSLWDRLPALTYLGVSCLFDADNYYPPPQDHPLRTVANLERDSIMSARRLLAKIVINWKGLKTMSDSHQWEDMPDLEGYIEDKRIPFIHAHDGPFFCSICIVDIAHVCKVQGLRYEDRFGRSREEYELE